MSTNLYRRRKFQKSLDLPGPVVAFRVRLARLGGGVISGLLLSQCLFWQDRTCHPDGWFYKTQSDWEQELFISRRELATARKELMRIGVLSYSIRGCPPVGWYRVNSDRLLQLLQKGTIEDLESGGERQINLPETELLFGQDPANKLLKSAETNKENNEITAKNTTEKAVQAEDHSPFLQIWNENRGPLAVVLQLTTKRRAMIKARLTQQPSFIDQFEEAVKKAANTPFLCGENDRGWRASFDWMISNDTNVIAVLEGKYDRGRGLQDSRGAYNSGDSQRYGQIKPTTEL